jgi:hypothetical protein
VKTTLVIKENDEHALDFALHLSRRFRSRLVLTFRVQLLLSTSNSCLIIARISVAFFPRSAQNLMLFHCRIRREMVSSQVDDSK